MARHATHFSKPNEQTKILKICALIPIEAFLNFISIVEPNAYVYLDPWIDVFQAWALGSFFLLMCEFVSPSAQFRDVFFAAFKVPQRRRNRDPGLGGLEWYRKQWFAVFQYLLISIGVAIATDITQAINKYCLESNSIHFAQLWLSIISNISVAIALTSVLRFYGALKKDLKHHKPLAKLVAFKLIIFLSFVQSIIFQILRSQSVLNETSTLTYADVNIGIQTMIICIEMVPISLYFHYAYDVKAYDITQARPLPISDISGSRFAQADLEANPQLRSTMINGLEGQAPTEHTKQLYAKHADARYYGGFLGLRAWASVPDPREIIRAIRFAFVMRSEAIKMKMMSSSSSSSQSNAGVAMPHPPPPPPCYDYHSRG
ncbi:hypothetical protein B0A52_08504 [Exophiala mesophila]|uniref:DUF300 domain protein n=1 Tax=Exophiala mesophila TaxID=212818 RepID=A0A438MXQ4_EXOME|nr:hypothetical protein B0A52_08504 [Exophiala mesophila]